VAMRLLVALLCLFPATGFCGRYVVSESWPTGTGTDISRMAKEDRPLCKAFESALRVRGPLDGPLPCERNVEGSKEVSRPSWTALDRAKIYPLVQRLEALLAKRKDRDAPWVESETFKKNVTKLVEDGEMTIALTTVPAKPDGTNMLVLRYQRRACKPKNESDYARVHFFSADSEALENLDLLRGLGHPTSILVYKNRAYFDGHSYRSFDDSFTKRLPKSQPVIYLHRMFDDRAHITVCRLLYRD